MLDQTGYKRRYILLITISLENRRIKRIYDYCFFFKYTCIGREEQQYFNNTLYDRQLDLLNAA